LYSFREYLNEINVKGEVIKGKPLWNGGDYLDGAGNINLTDMGLKEIPCIFPEKWDKSFWCGNNQLTSLDGVPKEIGGGFGCMNNKLTSLKGAPRKVGGVFNCSRNTTKFTEEDVRKVCEVGGIIIINF